MKILEVYRLHPDGVWGFFDTVVWQGHTLEEVKDQLIAEGWIKDIQVRYTDPHGNVHVNKN